jgi:hypothetical protein
VFEGELRLHHHLGIDQRDPRALQLLHFGSGAALLERTFLIEEVALSDAGHNQLQIGDLNLSSFEIDYLSKTCQGEVETKALHNFSLWGKQGESIVFIGPN